MLILAGGEGDVAIWSCSFNNWKSLAVSITEGPQSLAYLEVIPVLWALKRNGKSVEIILRLVSIRGADEISSGWQFFLLERTCTLPSVLKDKPASNLSCQA